MKLWNMKVIVIPIIVGALEPIMRKNVGKRKVEMEISESDENVPYYQYQLEYSEESWNNIIEHLVIIK